MIYTIYMPTIVRNFIVIITRSFLRYRSIMIYTMYMLTIVLNFVVFMKDVLIIVPIDIHHVYLDPVKPTGNFERNSLFNLTGEIVLVPLTMSTEAQLLLGLFQLSSSKH